MKPLFFFIICIFLIGLVSAVSINNPNLPMTSNPNLVAVNYSEINVNTSNYTDCWTTIEGVVCDLSDIGTSDLTNDAGFISSYTDTNFSTAGYDFNNYYNKTEVDNNLSNYAKYQFEDNDFNGSGDFTTTGTGSFGELDVDNININGNTITSGTGTVNFDDDIPSSSTGGTFADISISSNTITASGSSISFGGDDAVTQGEFKSDDFNSRSGAGISINDFVDLGIYNISAREGYFESLSYHGIDSVPVTAKNRNGYSGNNYGMYTFFSPSAQYSIGHFIDFENLYSFENTALLMRVSGASTNYGVYIDMGSLNDYGIYNNGSVRTFGTRYQGSTAQFIGSISGNDAILDGDDGDLILQATDDIILDGDSIVQGDLETGDIQVGSTDNKKVSWGTGADSFQYWSGTNHILNTTTGNFIIYNNSGYGTIEYGSAIDHTPTFTSKDFYDRLVSNKDILDEENKVVRFEEEKEIGLKRADYSRPMNVSYQEEVCNVKTINVTKTKQECDYKLDKAGYYIPDCKEVTEVIQKPVGTNCSQVCEYEVIEEDKNKNISWKDARYEEVCHEECETNEIICSNVTKTRIEYPEIEVEGRDTSKSIDINRIMISELKEEIQLLKTELCELNPASRLC